MVRCGNVSQWFHLFAPHVMTRMIKIGFMSLRITSSNIKWIMCNLKWIYKCTYAHAKQVRDLPDAKAKPKRQGGYSQDLETTSSTHPQKEAGCHIKLVECRKDGLRKLLRLCRERRNPPQGPWSGHTLGHFGSTVDGKGGPEKTYTCWLASTSKWNNLS